jgi:LasA protease
MPPQQPLHILRQLVVVSIILSLLWLALQAMFGADAPEPEEAAEVIGQSVDEAEMDLASGTGQGSLDPQPFRRSGDQVLQDGEFVYGPAMAGFDTGAFIRSIGGPLANYSEAARGGQRSAAEVIDYVARQHSISPRLLLALIELESGWLGGNAQVPSGFTQPSNLFNRAGMMAAWLADGYYGMKHRGTSDLSLADGSVQSAAGGSTAAHFAVARYLGRGSDAGSLPGRFAEFAAVYDRLFGPAPSLPPPVPPTGLLQPPFLLPWAEGERWHYTGGPHGAWGIATAWGAVDFAPPTMVGCRAAPEWVIAAAPGVVTWSDDGLVLVDLDGDGFDGTGWVLAYLHMATESRVAVGSVLAAGDRIGHPSCEGGVADGAHVHFARRYNGEWLPADGGAAPLNLSGWTFTSYGSEYDGSMAHPGDGTRMAVTSRRPGETEVVSDNGPARRAALADAWPAAGNGRLTGLHGIASPDEAAALPAPPTELAQHGALSGDASVPASSPETVGANRTAIVVDPSKPTLTVRVELRGRSSHASPIVVGLARPGAPPSVLMAETDASGSSGPIALPDSIHGRYAVVVRTAGFMPAEHTGVALGEGQVAIDFTEGGVVALDPGDMNHDRTIDPHDLAAWFELWWQGSDSADLNGDGSASAGDLWQILRGLRDDDR